MKTAAELRASHPDLVAEIERQAQASERERIKAIDEIAGGIPPEMVANAKFDEPISAAELALAGMKASKSMAAGFLAAIDDDEEESGASEVDSDPNGGSDGKDEDDKEAEASISAAAAIVNAASGRKER